MSRYPDSDLGLDTPRDAVLVAPLGLTPLIAVPYAAPMDSEKSSYIVVFVTAPADCAAALARVLVEEELAACANIIPTIRSIYRWEGDICDDAEALMVIKTRRTLFEALRDRVVSLHPYDVPEVVALPLTLGHEPYLQWLEASTCQPGK